MAAPILPSRLTHCFQRMVDIYSPSGKEGELADFLDGYLQAEGLHVTSQPLDGARRNLLVHSGKGEPEVLFLGHIDTVPAFDIEHYGFQLRENRADGLGTADMKGGCAAMIEAFISTARHGTLPDNVLLALVVGEEETGDGTQKLLEEYTFQQALVAEPSNLAPCLEHYGYVELNIRAFGFRRHAAMSNRETNAIRAMLRLLLHLEERIEHHEPETIMNIRDLHSSESGFAVPDRCAAGMDLHIAPSVHAAQYAGQLRAYVEQELMQSGASRHEIECPTLSNGYRLNPQEPVVQHARQVFATLHLPWEPVAFRSHSDANLLRDAGCRPLILGPGQLAKAHTRDESIDMDQVVSAARIYACLLARLAKVP